MEDSIKMGWILGGKLPIFGNTQIVRGKHEPNRLILILRNTLAWFRDGAGFVTGGEDGYVRVHHLDKDYFSAKRFE